MLSVAINSGSEREAWCWEGADMTSAELAPSPLGRTEARQTFCRSLVEDFGKSRYLQSVKTEFAPLFQLARAERLQLVEDLWDSLAQEDEAAPVSDWKREELRRRKERFLADPASGFTWEQVKQRAREGHA